MKNDSSNPNIEWKKSGFAEQEKITLKVNVAKAVEYEAKQDNVVSKKAIKPADLPIGLKKIRKKIKSSFDEDDEDDELESFIVDPMLQNMSDSSLMNALQEEEKKLLQVQENNRTMNQQLETEKLGMINMANTMAQEAGFKGLKAETINKGLMDNSIDVNKINKTIKQEFKKELKLNNKWNSLSDQELQDLMKGIHKIKNLGGKDTKPMLKDMDAKDIIKTANESKSDKEIARTICIKTGRVEEKKPHNKNEQEKIEKKMVKNQKLNNKYANDRERS